MKTLKLKEEGLYFIAEAMDKVREMLQKEFGQNFDDVTFEANGDGEITALVYAGGKIEGETLFNFMSFGLDFARNKEYTAEEKEIVKTIENITHHLLSQAKDEHRKSIISTLSHTRLYALKEKLDSKETTKRAKEEITGIPLFNYLVF